MKIGFLFPGQGAQSLVMGKDIYEKYKEIQEIYNEVKEITGIDVAEITFDGPEEKLNETKYTQICILTMSLGILKILEQNGIKAEVSSGLSLGEYSALIYSKLLSFEDGIKIIQKRGEYMQNLVPEGEWLMAAILGMDEKQVEEVCNKVTQGFVVPVNYNAPGQIVISGDKQGVKQAEIISKEMGAKKVRVLKTSGPFHTKKLIKASKALSQELDKVQLNEFETTVIKNLDGKTYTENDDVKEILTKHIVSPVRFSTGLQTMLDMGVDTFIEIGPGKTLSGFVKRMPSDRKINILNVNSVETLENAIKFISNF